VLLTAAAAASEGAERGPVSLCLSPPPGASAVEACRAARRLELPAVRARNVRLALARALAAATAYPEAIDAYRDAVRADPEDAEGWLRLGEALLYLGDDPRAAIEELQVGLRIDPQSARGYAALGAALHAMGEHPEAAASFAEALRLDPDLFTNRPAAREMDAASKQGIAWPPAQAAAPGS
jgi:tetratricopeptide (TPR) repeat protein